MKEIAFNIGDSFFKTPGHFLTKLTGIGTLASILFSNAIVIAGIVLIILFIIAGIQMISGSGEPQKIEQARNIITAGIIGFILVIAAYYIVKLVELSLGINLFS